LLDISLLELSTLQSYSKPLEGEALRRMLAEAKKDRLGRYRPYFKQGLFHSLGKIWNERLLRAGNQQGKTHAGGMEMAFHLTGLYPAWWIGRTFDKPIDAWACCDTGETTRDNPQRVLIGPIGEWGTGTIPDELVIEYKRGRGVADLLDTVLVRHVSGGISRLGFKRYDQGREAFQGPSKDVVWCDEEPPEDVYGEILARLVATDGMAYTTFTPLLGMSKVVEMLIHKGGDVNMTIDDAEHISKDRRDAIVARFPEHERDARAMGIPMLGGGRVFPIGESAIKIEPFAIPPHWALIGGMDFGWDHPFAAVRLAWDRDADVVYLTHEYRIKEQTPVVHTAAIKGWGTELLWAWPHDGHQHDKGSGVTLASQYRKAGLRTMTSHATHPDGGYGTEAGVMAMLDRMKTGRFKVFTSCQNWFDEFRHYHRLKGLIVKERDDLLSATRVAIMELRRARSPDMRGRSQATADSAYNPLDGIPHDRERVRGVTYGTDERRTIEEHDYDVLH
jgi:phage terminase large subunit-like protein